ncbi:MAG: M1 family aminopeptidase, partial [Gemmataceae bacterium]
MRSAAAAICLIFLWVGAIRGNDHTTTLPQYDLQIRIDTQLHLATIRSRITWTNTHQRPATDFVLNFYPHYRVPEGDHLLLAKTLELLRLNPSQGIDRLGRAGVISGIRITNLRGKPIPEPQLAPYSFRHDNMTAIVVELPEAVLPGESITVEVDCCIRMPNKQGRWGHWEGVHYLTNAMPTVAYYDAMGWHAMPFVPWHQPWWNEAGHIKATIELPAAEKVACSAPIESESAIENGWKRVVTAPFLGRDFAIVASPLFQEYSQPCQLPSGRTVQVKCLAFPQHEFYAKEICRIVAEAIPVYSRWFGDYPYSQITMVESYFGWNGNECAGLIMVDERVFAMPHLGVGYVEYLVSHETCHQWWYNQIGTNGYAETFMDEGAAAFFTHKLMDQKLGK